MGISGSVVCLLPARNAAADLAGYLESVGRFADAIVALDDGSIDATGDILESHPLVRVLLTNPRRDDDRSDDDADARNRLLDAAAELDPEWIISLDADERIDPDDAEALRGFLDADAIPGCAYGFRHYRMWGDDAYDPRFKWIFRLFSYEPGQQFPADRLHFSPIPTSIPADRWFATTIRVKHYGAADEHRMADRRAKYREADPEREFPTNWGGLDTVPAGELPRWRPRSATVPILVSLDDPLIPDAAGDH